MKGASVHSLFFSPPGVPGVKPERYREGLEVKHCALSLVGEPIMYPEINGFIRLLHSHHISSFLVTNAQFPEEIRYDHTHSVFLRVALFRSCPRNNWARLVCIDFSKMCFVSVAAAEVSRLEWRRAVAIVLLGNSLLPARVSEIGGWLSLVNENNTDCRLRWKAIYGRWTKYFLKVQCVKVHIKIWI